jgi:non-canonical (house-cleaning) NTP pyrophosphatase
MFVTPSDSLPLVVVIATKNPGKIQAVEEAFRQLCPTETITFLSCAAPSGVSDQPMTSEETLLGTFLLSL